MRPRHSQHSPRLIENSGWLLGLRRKLKLCRTYRATTRDYGCKPANLFDLCAPVSNVQCALLLVVLNQLLLKVSYFTNPLIPWQLPNRHHFEGQVLTMEFLQMLGNWFNILHNSAESRDYGCKPAKLLHFLGSCYGPAQLQEQVFPILLLPLQLAWQLLAHQSLVSPVLPGLIKCPLLPCLGRES